MKWTRSDTLSDVMYEFNNQMDQALDDILAEAKELDSCFGPHMTDDEKQAAVEEARERIVTAVSDARDLLR